MSSLQRVTCKYILGSTGENAANVFWLTGAGDFTVQSDADFVTTKVNAWFNSLTALYISGTKLQGVRVDQVNPSTGKVMFGFDGTPSGSTGNGGATALPTECSIVVSLRTALAGPSKRGRIYLPTFAASHLTSDGRLASLDRDSVATATQTMFQALLHGPSVQFTPVVYSRHLRTTQAITSVSVGDVFDVQRSRRNRLIEGRSTLPIA